MQTKENYYYLSSAFLFYLCSIKSYPLKHNNEELRNRNSRSFVILNSNNPTYRFILSKTFSCKSYGKTLENQHETRNDYRILVNRQRTAFKNSLIYD
mgnify:CR=1 FL=1